MLVEFRRRLQIETTIGTNKSPVRDALVSVALYIAGEFSRTEVAIKVGDVEMRRHVIFELERVAHSR